MGQKVSPHGLRVGIIKNWSSTWYANKQDYSNNLVEDYNIRTYLKNLLKPAGIYKIEISRKGDRVLVDIHAAKPGMIIGKGGAAIEEIKNKLSKKIGKEISLNIVEVKGKDVNLAAQLVAENIALQLEKRISFRRAMKQAMKTTMDETYHEGTIPLQTLRADIDYGFAEAKTTYGIIGVKVWIYKGEVLPTRKTEEGGN